VSGSSTAARSSTGGASAEARRYIWPVFVVQECGQRSCDLAGHEANACSSGEDGDRVRVGHDCNWLCTRIDLGDLCPHRDESVAISDLIDTLTTNKKPLTCNTSRAGTLDEQHWDFRQAAFTVRRASRDRRTERRTRDLLSGGDDGDVH
jgi:hypothetical protein